MKKLKDSMIRLISMEGKETDMNFTTKNSKIIQTNMLILTFKPAMESSYRLVHCSK